jgi:hypothetical protein
MADVLLLHPLAHHAALLHVVGGWALLLGAVLVTALNKPRHTEASGEDQRSASHALPLMRPMEHTARH